MRLPSAPLSCLLALAGLLAACGKDAPDLPPPSPALWEVIGANGEHGYLFGTVHALPEGFDWETDTIEQAFERSETLAVELDPRSLDDDLFWELATTEGLGRPSLRVSPAHRRALAALIEKSYWQDEDLADTESWAVAMIVSDSLAFGESENGVDRALLAMADSRRVVELEGYFGQLAIFDTLPPQDQIDMLEILADSASGAAQEAEAQVGAWRRGDVATLEASLAEGLMADPELRAALLVQRNLAWAEQVEQLLQSGDTPFVAVGAAHLLGADGLPRLLAARGYTVTRIQ
ncbi:MAG TPA: TraB/GumN family protein [Sphingomonadaceae bacterium]|nr:TraB/GumN family protein [Sphingomonadaceae bacterium]